MAILIMTTVYIRDNRMSNFRGDFIIFINDTTTADQLLDRFRGDTLVKSIRSLERAFRKEDMAHQIREGRYEIKKEQSSIEVARMIKRGWQRPCRLTISGTIRTKGVLASKIAAQMMVDSTQIADALNDDGYLGQFGFHSGNVFSMVLPDTYEMYWNATPYEILKRFYVEYEAFWNENRIKKARQQGLTPLEVSILASIVAGETNRRDEYPYVARVYLNRLHKHMKLQACPTICYIYDYKITRVLRSHLKNDSPYNTYMYEGLPPGPICVPPKACIDAVLNPAEGNYLYFSANPAFDGTNRFTSTYSEHQQFSKEYHKAISEKQKAEREAAKAASAAE
ncbi:MAG: endolytic transglycosylase MltG [Bacteroidales bacterium]|nr:endolytic transglycosylase MltG [Bacteroidales bacterium]